MTDQFGVVSRLRVTSVKGLRGVRMDRWLWLDMARPAIRLEPDLRDLPVDAGHLWGWSDMELVRARLDPDLPGGVAGALLTLTADLTGGGPGAVMVRSSEVTTWQEHDTTVSPAYPSGLGGGQQFRVFEARAVARSEFLQPGSVLQFIRMELG